MAWKTVGMLKSSKDDEGLAWGTLGEGNGTPLQYFCLENPMDRGAWWATVHGVAKSGMQLSHFTHSLTLLKFTLLLICLNSDLCFVCAPP